MTARPDEGRGAPALWPILLIVSLFFLWGLANNLNDILIAQFRKAFALTDMQSSLVQSAFYLGYLLLALPAALFMRLFGYKAAVLLGLCLYGLGALLFYPAAEARIYGAFLGALFVIASGLAFLETSANPLMIALGDPATGARRLGLAQAFNPAGSIAGVFLGQQFIFSGVEHSPAELAAMSARQVEAFHRTEAHAVQLPYLAIGAFVLAWAALIAVTRFPKVAGREAEAPRRFLPDLAALLGRPRYWLGVLAQFFYVGAQVGVWSFLIRYAQREAGAAEKLAASYLMGSLAAFMVGRFVGTALMGRIRPERLMGLYAVVNTVLCLVAVAEPGPIGLWALVASSFFMSVMYPTIFALGVRDLGPLTKLGSSALVMAIIGGAALTFVMGLISDASSIATAMVVPAAAFAVVGLFAFTTRAAGPDEAPLAVAADLPA